MLSPSTDESQSQSGQAPTTETFSSVSLNRTADNQAMSWHLSAVHEGVDMDEVHRFVNDFLGMSTTGEVVVKQEVTQDEQLLTEGDTSQKTTDKDQNVGYHIRTRATSHRRRDSQSSSSTESDDMNFEVNKNLKHKEVQGSNNDVSVSEKLDVCTDVDNSGIDVHWVRNDKMYKCDICPKVLKKLEPIRAHIRSHLGVKPFTCKVEGCQAAYNMIYPLCKHIREHHSKGACKPKRRCRGQCDICGILLFGDTLKYHKETVHFKLKRYKCYGCHKRFREKSKLESHMIVHKNDFFKCDTCFKTFTSQARFNIHKKQHVSFFKCDICTKVFKSKNFLQGHLLQHEGIHKHCCNVCGKTFVHAHYLFTHMKSHGEKKFICHLCGGKFNRKDNLKSHIVRHMLAEEKKGKLK